MTRVRRQLSTFALVSAVALAAAGCHKKLRPRFPRRHPRRRRLRPRPRRRLRRRRRRRLRPRRRR